MPTKQAWVKGGREQKDKQEEEMEITSLGNLLQPDCHWLVGLLGTLGLSISEEALM